jgi:hypothetical protein
MVSGLGELPQEVAGGREAPLVLSTDISTPDPLGSSWGEGRKWCQRSPDGIRLQLPDGRLVPVRCGSPNKCDFCAYMAAVECGALILLDGLEDGPPEVAVTLTTRNPDTPMERFRRDVEKAVKAIRRRHPEASYFARIEYTTGKAQHSGGRRRIHAHMLFKAIPADECAALELVVRRVWKERTGAHRIEVAQMRSAAGAMHYVTEHFAKAIQRPPRGWTGRTTRYSIPRGERRGYFVRPLDERREQARELLRDRRVERRLKDVLAQVDVEPGELGEGWDAMLSDAIERASERGMKTQLVRVAELPQEFGSDGLPTSWSVEVLGPLHES